MFTEDHYPRWASVPQVARVLACSVHTVRDVIYRGDWIARRLGTRGAWRVLIDSDGWPIEVDTVPRPRRPRRYKITGP